MLILGYKLDAFVIIQNPNIVVQEMQLKLVVVKIELQSKWAVSPVQSEVNDVGNHNNKVDYDWNIF